MVAALSSGGVAIHRVTVTQFRSIGYLCQGAGLRRRLVGKTLIMFVAVISPKYALLIC